MDKQTEGALNAMHDLQRARDSLSAFYWSESDYRKTFHYDNALNELRSAVAALGFELVALSKEEAA